MDTDAIANILLNSQVALTPLLAQLSDSFSLSHRKKRASDELHSLDNVDSMYGTLMNKLEVTTEDGEKVAVDWINPFGLIAHA